MEQIRSFLSKDQFARHNGIELLDCSKGTARAKMEIKDYHLNGVGIVHGGAIFALADFVFAAASNSHGTVAVAINASIWYVKAASEGTLFAEAEEVSLQPKLATYSINVTNEDREIIASFQGMVYRKRSSRPTS